MKVLTILAAIAVTSSSAMALDTVMGLKGRFDYVRTETEVSPGGAEDSSGIFTTSFLRLVTESKLNDTTKAKLTLDFKDSDKGLDNGLSEFVDEAYLTKAMGPLSVMLGKQPVMVGGRENDYSTRDVYLLSRYNFAIPFNPQGISAGYSMAGQNLYLQYLQQRTADQAPLSDKKIIGAAYYGEFMDKMIMPIISYHKMGTSRVGSYDTFGAVGLRLNVANFMVEFDYLMLEQEKLSALGDAELETMVAHVRYSHENFQPFAKFIKEDGKKGFTGLTTGTSIATAGLNESERTAWEVGLEYVPNKDEDFRYHVVYNNSEVERNTAAPTSKFEAQTIFAGVAFNYNILK